MLFSYAPVSDFINDSFEPAWQSVRPAAMIRVDFGNGNVVTRTLNGNVATCVCNADGSVLDVIPGVYDPEGYFERLNQAILLHRWAGGQRSLDAFLRNYHSQQAAALREHSAPGVIVEERIVSIRGVEVGLRLVLKSSREGEATGLIAGRAPRTASGRPPYGALAASATRPASASGATADGISPPDGEYELPPDLASRLGRVGPEMLADDTRHNESVRRLKVHDHLAAHSPQQPADLTKWLYREVLDTDLDDPYLGLGKLLFATYPFAEEDGRRE